MFKKRNVSKQTIKKSNEDTSDFTSSTRTKNLLASQTNIKKKRLEVFSDKVKEVDPEIIKDEDFRVIYDSEKKLNIGNDQGATATIDYDTEIGQDHRSVLERNEEIGKKLLSGELEEGIYRGLGAQRPLINVREGAIAAGKSTGHYGPVRGNQHVRMTMRVDLNPEICKDYKETGYCGFGDTCIFLHDRSDYKPGWLIEKEWHEEQKRAQKKAARKLRKMDRNARKQAGEPLSTSSSNSDSDSDSSNNSDSDDETSIPKACGICKKEWLPECRPIVTM